MVSVGTMLSNRYVIVRELGAGGMGAVYEATDLRTGGTVAVKTLHQHFARDAQFVARLRREAQIAASIRTPRAVKVLDLDEFEGTHFLVMEYVTGENLSDRVEREGRLPLDESLAICIDIVRALEGAHAVGVVHRDLKPQNVRLTDEGEVKVLDFGIARIENQPGITNTNVFTGTPEYCAPERLDGQGDIRSDIYSVGVMLFELLSGQRPFTGPTAFSVLRQHEVAPVPPLPVAVPAAVQAVIDRCLAKRPDDRYQTPAELLAALREARDAVARGDAPLPPPSTPAPLPSTVVQPGMVRRPEPSPAVTVPLGGAPVPAPPPAPALVEAPAVRTVERPPGATGPTPPPDGSLAGRRGSRLPVIAGVAAAAVLLLAGVAFAAMRGSGSGSGSGSASATVASSVALVSATGTTTPAPTATPSATRSPSSPTAPALPALIAPGEKIALNVTQEASLQLGTNNCPRASAPPKVRLALTINSIERDGRNPSRLTVAYVRKVAAEPGVECTLRYDPDAYGGTVTLDATRVVDGKDVIQREPSVDGSGLSINGSDNIYGREIPGTWVFDGVDVNTAQLFLVQRLSDETVLHRIKLLPR